MARTPKLSGAPGLDRLPSTGRRFSAWTLVVPLALAACVYVVASIIGSTRWTIGATGHTQPVATQSAHPRVPHEYITRSGDTWRSVARRTHLSTARLHDLNPRDTARGRIIPGERLLLRP